MKRNENHFISYCWYICGKIVCIYLGAFAWVATYFFFSFLKQDLTDFYWVLRWDFAVNFSHSVIDYVSTLFIVHLFFLICWHLCVFPFFNQKIHCLFTFLFQLYVHFAILRESKYRVSYIYIYRHVRLCSLSSVYSRSGSSVKKAKPNWRK